MRESGRTCLIIAHRGASIEAPENTLAAFAQAVERGADMIEFDLQATADGVLVVMHDEDVRRTTNGHGLIRRLSFREIQELDAGSWFGPEFALEPVPTFSEICKFATGKVRLNIEVKCSEPEFVELVEAFLLTLNETELLAGSIVSSFDLGVLAALRRASSEIALAYLFHAVWVPPHIDELNLLDLYALHPHHVLLNESRIERTHQHGLAVHAWTVDNPRRMQRLYDWGVDGIITNDPGTLMDLLRR